MLNSDLPLLSVVIPTYNRSGFLRQCVQSLRQCGYTKLEVIIVDDGSTENIAEGVRSFEPSCMLLRQKNQGPNAARNKGFGCAKGRYISFVDSDDQWLPGLAQKIIMLLEKYPEVDMIFTEAKMGNKKDGYQSWINIAGEEDFFRIPFSQTCEGLRIFDSTSLLKRMLIRNPVFIGAVIMRRESFARAGMFDATLRMAEDWEFWLRMAASQMQLAYYNEPLANYTRHIGCTSNDHDQMGEGFYIALKKIRQKFPNLGPEEMRIIDSQLRFHLFSQGYGAYDRGDYQLARKRFLRLRQETGLSVMGILYWLLCLFPENVIQILRQFKWKLRYDK